MRAFLWSRAEATYTESSVEEPAITSSVKQPAESSAPSIVDQPAESFASIGALNRWLRTQIDASSGADFQRLRAAVMILMKKTESATGRDQITVPFVAGASVCTEKESTTNDLDRRVAASGPRRREQALQ